MARVPSSIEGPAVAVDRSACSSTRGGCTEARVKQDVQPEHVPAQHPIRSMAAVNARVVDESFGCADVTKRQVSDTCINHSTCPQPMTSAVQHCIITTSVHTKAPGSSTAGRNRPRPVSSRVSSQHKLKGERKNTGSTSDHQQQQRTANKNNNFPIQVVHGVDSTSTGTLS